jgi:hypothetical protein
MLLAEVKFALTVPDKAGSTIANKTATMEQKEC